MIQPNYKYTGILYILGNILVRYLFVSRNVLVLFLFVSMEQTPLFVIFFFLGSVRSFRICTAVFIKIFVIVYSNIFFCTVVRQIFFFLVVSVLYCNTKFCSVHFLFGLFLQYKYCIVVFRPVRYYKMPIQILFSFLYCSFFFFVRFVFTAVIRFFYIQILYQKKKKQQRLYTMWGETLIAAL